MGGEPIATISNASGAVLFADGRAASVAIGSTLGAGALELRSGLLELTYPSGVVLVLESPNHFALHDATSVGLSDGNLSARVPPAALGFAVETASGRIVDLGTEFGVSAGAASSEVHVFKGEVIVKTPGEPDPLRLTSNCASRIDTQTQTPAGIDFQPERFFRTFEEPSSRYSELIQEWLPVAYYRMQLTSAATQLIDLSARQLNAQIIHGTIQCAFVPGKIGAGLRLASTPCAGLSQFAPPALGIGVKLDASGRQPEINTPGFWDGALDELAIFHHTLSPDQILALYEAAR